MNTVFPSKEWVQALEDKLNTDERYAHIARKWEGDLLFDIQPEGALTEPTQIYLDLWHGKCRGSRISSSLDGEKPAFILKAPYRNFVRILKGQLDPMQAMLTQKLQVLGSLPYILRNVPVVLDFVRCAREVTTKTLGE